MKNHAKIQLSDLERELVNNADWILTKNGILRKVQWLFESLMEEHKAIIDDMRHVLPDEITRSVAKISRGEKYLGLPYLVLDQPRHFDKTNMLLMRTLFWWGNFFSTTLQLSGTYSTAYSTKIAAAFELLKTNDYYLCINDDPWEHHFDETNYVPVSSLAQQSFETAVRQKPFIKISRKIKLAHWGNAESLLTGDFRQLIQLLAN